MSIDELAPAWASFAKWSHQAWSRFGWKQLCFAAALVVPIAVIGPMGGSFMIEEGSGSPHGQVELFLSGEYLLRFLPMIFLAMVADAAYRDGVPARRAYFLAWAFGSTVGAFLTHYTRLALGMHDGYGRATYLLLHLAMQGGLLLWMYAHWQTTQATRRAAEETARERAEDEQRLQRTLLKELQVRIDPQLLFDTLTDVAELHERDPLRSRRVLDDLIVYLRALLPNQNLDTPTIADEAALADAWWRVRMRRMIDAPPLPHRFAATIGSEPIAPMVVIGLVQVASNVALPFDQSWALDYKIENERVLVALRAPERIDWAVSAQTDEIRRRVDDGYGPQAAVGIRQRPPCIELDLPRIATRP